MKLHLPLSLRSALLAVLAVVSFSHVDALTITIDDKDRRITIDDKDGRLEEKLYTGDLEIEILSDCKLTIDSFYTKLAGTLTTINVYGELEMTEGCIGDATLISNSISTSAEITIGNGGRFVMKGGDIAWATSSRNASAEITIGDGGRFTMTGGMIARAEYYSSASAEITIGDGGLFEMNRGTIAYADDKSTASAKITIENGGRFTMRGGTIADTKSWSTASAEITIERGGRFEMNGGNIYYGTGYGTGITIEDGGVFEMNGGGIVSSFTIEEGGRLEVKGENKQITIDGVSAFEMMHDAGFWKDISTVCIAVGEKISFGIRKGSLATADNGNAVSKKIVVGEGGCFTLDTSAYIANAISSSSTASVEITIEDGGLFVMRAGNIAYATESSSRVSAEITIENGGVFEMSDGNIAYTTDSSSSASAEITIRDGGVFMMLWYGTGTIAYRFGTAEITIEDGGRFEMGGGDIAYYSGTAEITIGDGGCFEMSGGSIAPSASTAEITIGDGGRFEMSGGSIAYSAGTAEITIENGGCFEMNRGYIGSAKIMVENGGRFELNGGSIAYANYSTSSASAGITVENGGHFVMNGGYIAYADNSNSSASAEITIEDGGLFEMNDGTNNSCVTINEGGRLVMKGGTVSEVVIQGDAKFEWIGGTLTKSLTIGDRTTFTYLGDESLNTLTFGVAGTGMIDWRGKAAENEVIMKGGSMKNASKYAGDLYIRTDDSYKSELQLGGVSAAQVKEVRTGAGVTLAGLNGTLTLRDGDTLYVGADSVGKVGGTEKRAIITFDSSTSHVVFEDNITLTFEEGLYNNLSESSDDQAVFEIYFANVALNYSDMGKISFNDDIWEITDIVNGKLIIGISNDTGMEKRYWRDASWEKHEQDYVYDGGIADAKRLVIKDNFKYKEVYRDSWGYADYDLRSAGMALRAEKSEVISAEVINISGNVFYDDPGPGAGAVYMGLFGEDKEARSIAIAGCKEVLLTGNGAITEEYGSKREDLNLYSRGNAGGIYFTGSCIEDEQWRIVERISVLEFKDNDKVTIRGNYSQRGIWNYDRYLYAYDIDDYDFFTDMYKQMYLDGKYDTIATTGCLFAINTTDADVAFEAKAGQVVECYDSIWVDGTLWINTTLPKLRKSGDSYTGTVIFSGEHTVEDLVKAIGKAPTAYEIYQSRQICAENVYVNSGTLVIKNMEIQTSCDFSYSKVEHDYLFYSAPQAEVQLTDAAIRTNWYDGDWSQAEDGWWWNGEGPDKSPDQLGGVYLPKAGFSGSNTIEANYILAENSTWTFNVSAANLEAPVVRIVFDNVHAYGKQQRGLYTPGMTFHINLASGLGGGQYKLLELDSSLGEWVGRDAVTLAGAVSGKIARDSGKVYYTIDAEEMLTLWYNNGAGPATPGQPEPEQPEPTEPSEGALTWVAGNGTWAVGAAGAQWGSESGSAAYRDGASVVFDSAARVSIRSVVLPGDVLVSNESGVVELSSADGGQISGATRLTKTGAGELALNLANAYTGGTVVHAGRLTVGNAHALGLGDVQLWGGELDMGGYAVQNDVRVTGAAAITGGEAFAGDLTLEHAALAGDVAVSDGARLSATDSTLYGSLALMSGARAQVEGKLTLAAGSRLSTTAAQSIQGGELELAGGTLKLADTLTVDALSITAHTEVLLDLATLREKRQMDVIRGRDLSGADETLLVYTQLSNARCESGKSGSSVWVKLNSASLTWQPGESGTWGLKEEGGEWGTDAEDRHFYDMDDVTFDSAGEVSIVGEVAPGSITVRGAGYTAFVGSGSITGEGKLTKTGSGYLEMATDNSAYSGDIEINGGTLHVGHEHALGSGAVYINDGASFDGGWYSIANTITFSGRSGISAADGASDVVFAPHAQVSGHYTLAMGNTLTTGSGASFSSGSITFAGGELRLEGAFIIEGEALFEANHAARSTAGSLTTINLSGWSDEELRFGDVRSLIRLDGDADTASQFTLSGLSEQMLSRATLVYDEEVGWLMLHIERMGLDENIAATLDSNRLSVYTALGAIAENGEDADELREMVNAVFGTDDPAEVSDMLDKLSGAELAAAMTSQLEGNMAHLRRLRANMGNARRLDAEGKNAAYIVGYDEQSHVDADAGKPGMKRSEWGGMAGYERSVGEQAILGFAIESGSAKVKPTQGESYDEDAVRADVYFVVRFGSAWQSVTSLGYGTHSFDATRNLPLGHTSKASMDGTSINFQQEISYTIRTSEENSWQPFALLEISSNSIDAFTESGAGTASLEGDSRSATAADLTLGSRYIHGFGAAGLAGSVSIQAGIVLSLGDHTADMEANFAGAPNRRFKIEAAEAGSVGFNLGAGLLYPLTKQTSVTGSANAILRSGATSWNVSAGVRLSF